MQRWIRAVTALERTRILVLLAGAAIAGQGCLMRPMSGGSMHEHVGSPTAIVKEVERDTILARLEVPPLRVGEPATLRATLSDKRTGAPLRAERVWITIQAPEQAGKDASATHQAVEMDSLGTYGVEHRFGAGLHSILVEAHVPGSETPIAVGCTVEVAPPARGMFGFGMHWVALASIGMALMMWGFMRAI